MKKLIFGSLVFLLLMVLAVGARAYTWTYNTTFDFALTGFSDPTNTPPTPTNGPLTLEISNITGLTLPNPPAGTYDWYLEIDSFSLDFGYGHQFADNNLGTSYIGTWEAPLSSSGSFSLGDFYVSQIDITYGGYSFSLGDYLVQNAIFSWYLYEDDAGTDLAEPGDEIKKIILTLTADNLDSTINADITTIDNILGGANGIIDGTGTADFKVSAVPEPSTVLLLSAGGLIALGVARKRLNKK
ncbi:PEP-CTERM sorting domain-containing protein [Thermodesulfatator autotrophicus]|uniref:Ice-binding protein C-terminal domain-containing protein n=1 Tax=Thermodesulfatator autotrophicus TaxID=1795632 RepID=A0A177EB32_9BACT|nr:PEP-CTERM sorting domain-containing protein [Thermodesulfatator autotrophicus]OAG28721.1 hypothetical protein TH606_00205 [Thermodesulfatator autotrophicus]